MDGLDRIAMQAIQKEHDGGRCLVGIFLVYSACVKILLAAHCLVDIYGVVFPSFIQIGRAHV